MQGADADNGADSDNDEMDDVQYSTRPVPFCEQGDLPRASLSDLLFSQDLIEDIKNGKLEDDFDDELVAKVLCPAVF